MSRYDLCAWCSRHVNRAEVACPFCGAHKAAAKARHFSVDRRMSRAEWLALGSAMVLGGCSGKELSTAPDGATSVNSVLLGFECGDAACDPRATFCLATGPSGDLSYSCESYDAGDWAPGDAACGTYPTCACSTWPGPSFDRGVCGCNDDAGAVTVIACHACYGAPPARGPRSEGRRRA